MTDRINLRIEIINLNTANKAIELLTALYLELGEEKESLDYLNKELLEKILATDKTKIYLGKSNEKIIGLFTLTESQAIYAGGTYGVIDEMYVLPAYRSQNIGKIFLEKIKKIGIEKGWKRIDVTAPTEEKWKRTVRFYEKNGFVFTGPKLKWKV